MDENVTKYLSKPIATHILNTPITIYLLKKYIPNKYVAAIRSHCSETDTKHYLMRKYNWTSKTIDNIEWNRSKTIIDTLSQAKRKLQYSLLTGGYLNVQKILRADDMSSL